MKISRFNIYLWLIAALAIVETLCFTYLRKFDDLRVFNAVLYFVCGLGICVFSLLSAVKTTQETTTCTKLKPFAMGIKYVGIIAFFIFICFLFIDYGNRIFEKHPISYLEADMLTLIKIACERLIHGQEVYKPVKEVWGGELIPYLPAMWSPFLPSVLMDIDIRWTSLILSINLCWCYAFLFGAH